MIKTENLDLKSHNRDRESQITVINESIAVEEKEILTKKRNE